MTHYTSDDIAKMETRFRATLINMLSGAKPAMLIGTISEQGITNCAIFNSILHIGANPPLMGFVLRPTTVERHTYNNFMSSGECTLNHIPVEYYKQAHQTSAKYPSEVSEFSACGFTPEFIEAFTAPFVAESPIQIGLRFIEELPIKLNGTILMIGTVEHIRCSQSPDESGHLHLNRMTNVAGLDTYYTQEQLATLPYSRVENTGFKVS
jgi:flavin reductase (DIM6/NTAB) family NADH-FMN oxidoreductase RutF